MPLRLAIGMMKDCTWHARAVYLTDLLRAVRDTYGTGVQLCLLPTERQEVPPDAVSYFVEIIAPPTLRKFTPLWALDRGAKRLLSRDVIGDSLLRRHRLDVIAFVDPLFKSTIPTLSFIPDFQHFKMPEMFSTEERQSRNGSYKRLARLSTLVILLSDDVKNHFESFAPAHAHKARVIRPVSYIPSRVYEVDPESVSSLYHLPERFVYLPSQFWRHKNHETVLRALKMLAPRGIRVFAACSGYPGDYRHPEHFADLLQKASRWDLRSQVAFLGVLPRDHVLSLIRQSVCVLNPSVFEGFGLTVEEARSVGKQLLISDIAPHREQQPPAAVFFNPRDAEDLADKLAGIWTEKPPGPDLELESQARRALPRRIRQYAESFVSVVQEAAGQTGSTEVER